MGLLLMSLSLLLLFKLTLILAGSIFSQAGNSAACCSGGGVASPIMTEQSLFELRLGVSRSSVVAEQFETDKPIFWDTQRRQYTTIFTPSLSRKLWGDWQLGMSVDLTAKDYLFDGGGQEKSTRLGDSRLLIAYELIYPSAPFVLRPQAFISLEHVFLTGRGLLQSQKAGLSDVSGLDQPMTSAGLHLYKRLSPLRYSFDTRLSYVYRKSIGETQLLDRFELQTGIGVLWSRIFSSMSGGLSLSLTAKQGRKRQQRQRETTAPSEQYFEISPYIIFHLDDRAAVSLTYADQTIFGPVKNTTLSRRIAMLYTYTFEQ
jgi:hypothetical protein